MTALYTIARGLSDNAALFGIIADETTAQFVDGGTIDAPDDSELDFYTEAMDQPPTTAQGWMDVAVNYLGSYGRFDEPDDAPDLNNARKLVSTELKNFVTASKDTPAVAFTTHNVGDAHDAATVDDPAVFDSMDEDDEVNVDPQAMMNFVMMALGPIDEQGPNSWLLDAADGGQVPDNAYVVFPHAPLSDDEQTAPEEDKTSP